MRGVPLRLEIGPRDVKQGQAVVVRRDTKTKEPAPLAALADKIPAVLADIQASLFRKALAFREANTREVADYAAFRDTMESKRGFIRAPWCGDEDCEVKIKDETMATIRVIPLDETEGRAAGTCVRCGREGKAVAYFARAY
jgi:prolyl-tRNA synthetase